MANQEMPQMIETLEQEVVHNRNENEQYEQFLLSALCAGGSGSKSNTGMHIEDDGGSHVPSPSSHDSSNSLTSAASKSY